MSVAHPDSPTFGQHWSPQRVMEHFAPSELTVSTVKSWLIASGFHPTRIRVSHNKGWIDVNATTSEVESLLDAEYYVYTHPSGQEQISPCCTALSPRTSSLTCATGCESYSVPDYVRKHVDLIKPTVHFIHRFPGHPAVHRKRSNINLGAPSPSNGPKTNGATVTAPLSLDNCDKFVTPACLRALYSIYYTPMVPRRNSYGIGAFSSAKPNSPLTPSSRVHSPGLYWQRFRYVLPVRISLPSVFVPNHRSSNFSECQEEKRPVLISIDGGGWFEEASVYTTE